MRPDAIKLNNKQRVIALLKAIDKEVPFTFLLALVLVAIPTILIPNLISPISAKIGTDIFIRHIVLRLVVLVGSFVTVGLIYTVIARYIVPLFERIKNNFNEESLKIKQEVLDNIIEDEVLNK